MRHTQDLSSPPKRAGGPLVEWQRVSPRRGSAEEKESEADERFEEAILPGVSRTFALTIPQLPGQLRRVVRNYYLLCRIADTIEDEPSLRPAEKERFHSRFDAVVTGDAAAEDLAAELHPKLSGATLPAERELVEEMPRVIRIAHGFSAQQRHAVARGLRIMNQGMGFFHRDRSLTGLRSLDQLDSYCYYVAGVVGEVLTELFCDHSPEIARHRECLRSLAVSFGQGLQMTNILKDIWDDRAQGVCWLPRDVFEAHGFDLGDLSETSHSTAFGDGLGDLIGITHGHLEHALDYVLAIPREERGIRRFCLWAIGLAVLTLRKIDRHRDFKSTAEAKISRRSVRWMIAVSDRIIESDALVRILFWLTSLGTPHTDISPQSPAARPVYERLES